MSIDSGLAAHFERPNGPRKAGVSWLVRIKHGGQAHHARVKALLAADASRATYCEQDYQARTTMQYLAELIELGWNPTQEREHTIEIGNSAGAPCGVPPRPWWRLW